MNKILAAAAAALLAVTLAACGGGSTPPAAAHPPVHSAATACHDFAAWFLKQDGNILAGNDMGLLREAVSAAPSGTLYGDLHTTEENEVYVLGQSGSLQTAEKGLTLTGMQQVETDCQSVNPG